MTSDFSAGNYRFIPAVFQYSAGAVASPGYEIERVRFDKMPPLAEGFAQIAKYIPGRVASVYEVDIPRPRAVAIQTEPEFIARVMEIKRRIDSQRGSSADHSMIA